MSTEREALRLQDIVDNIDRIDGYLAGYDYDLLDLPTIWRTVRESLPELREDCLRALESSWRR